MNESIVFSLVAILVAGVVAHWVAWRMHVSSILLFVAFGILLGPVSGFIQPDKLFGDMLLPVVSLSVALILFDGGLSLNISELKSIGRAVNSLISVGVLSTWVLSSLAAYFILGLNPRISALLGAVLSVTGPTVIIPLLRQVRPAKRVSSILRWEGILIDPIGALLAVVVFQAIVASDINAGIAQMGLDFLQSLITGGTIGYLGGMLVVLLLKNYWVPDYLHSPTTLMIVFAIFSVANLLQAESGLLAVTVMGITLANQKRVVIKKIVEFKETLRIMVLSSLFIILTARLTVSDLHNINGAELLFLIILICVVRPVSVALSTLGTNLKREDKIFLSFVAPRGVVAIAVASLFALRLREAGFAQIDTLVSITFMVVIGTVLVYSIAALPLAKLLGLAQPHPQGTLIVGAHQWARAIARVLTLEGYAVMMVDTNQANVDRARSCGIDAYQGSILAEDLEKTLDLNGVGRIFAITSNDEVNSLATVSFADLIGRANVYQLPLRTGSEVPMYLRGRFLFNHRANYEMLQEEFDNGASVRKIILTEDIFFEEFIRKYSNEIILLFSQDETGKLSVITEDSTPDFKAGTKLFIITRTEPQELHLTEEEFSRDNCSDPSEE